MFVENTDSVVQELITTVLDLQEEIKSLKTLVTEQNELIKNLTLKLEEVPPPYYVPGAPAPPPGASYAYVPVPAPVMMPVYHPPPPHPPPPHQPPAHYPPHLYPSLPPLTAPETPQPTYITNYIYQQSPQLEPEIDWVPATPATASQLSHRAFVAGKEGWDGSPLWIIRAHYNGDLVPGKLAIKHQAAYVPHGGKEVPVHSFEVLCAPQHSLRWMPASNGQAPVGAIPAGNTQNGEPLYISLCGHMGSTTPGKVHPSHGTAYISFGGSEIPYKSYKVLCKVHCQMR